MALAEKIRILLVKHGNISEAELARRMGISPQNLNNKMKRDNFTETDLREIANALHCTLNISFTTEKGEQIQTEKRKSNNSFSSFIRILYIFSSTLQQIVNNLKVRINRFLSQGIICRQVLYDYIIYAFH